MCAKHLYLHIQQVGVIVYLLYRYYVHYLNMKIYAKKARAILFFCKLYCGFEKQVLLNYKEDCKYIIYIIQLYINKNISTCANTFILIYLYMYILCAKNFFCLRTYSKQSQKLIYLFLFLIRNKIFSLLLSYKYY